MYSVISKAGISICIIGILFVVLNWFTGFINSTMTAGASAICFGSFIIALGAFMNISKAKKVKQ